MADRGDALAKLDERRLEQFVRELRLAGEDDLDELAARVFKVGKEANALEHGFREILGLVNHDDEFAAGHVFFDESFTELLVHFSAALGGRDAEIAQNVGNKLARLARGVEVKEKHHAGGFANVFEEAEQQCCLPHSGGRNHGRETAVAFEAFFKRFKRLLMGAAEKQASGIGAEPEWSSLNPKYCDSMMRTSNPRRCGRHRSPRADKLERHPEGWTHLNWNCASTYGLRTNTVNVT